MDTSIVNLEMPGRRPVTSLANPGDINKQVAKVLLEKVSAEKVADVIRDMLNATRLTKEGVEPDGRQREAGVKLWLAYMVGLPVQRQEIVSVALDAEAEIGMRERLRNSPALRASLRRVLDSLEEEAAIEA